MGTNVSILSWRINSTYRGSFSYLDGDIFPRSLSLYPPLPVVNITITSGSGSRIESTLNANVSSLRETLTECSSSVRDSLIIILLFKNSKVLYSKNVQNRN